MLIIAKTNPNKNIKLIREKKYTSRFFFLAILISLFSSRTLKIKLLQATRNPNTTTEPNQCPGEANRMNIRTTITTIMSISFMCFFIF